MTYKPQQGLDNANRQKALHQDIKINGGKYK